MGYHGIYGDVRIKNFGDVQIPGTFTIVVCAATAIGAGIIIGLCGSKLLTYFASKTFPAVSALFHSVFLTKSQVRACSAEKNEKKD